MKRTDDLSFVFFHFIDASFIFDVILQASCAFYSCIEVVVVRVGEYTGDRSMILEMCTVEYLFSLHNFYSANLLQIKSFNLIF